MSGRIVHVPNAKARHDIAGCQGKPGPEFLRRGTIWECDECGQQWVVVHGAQYNEEYSAWRKLTERNRDGYER